MMDINPSRPDPQQTGERPLNLSDFAQRNQITEDRVWELIEEGELAARFVNDEILILREQDALSEPEIDLPATPDIAIRAESVIPPNPVRAVPPDEPELPLTLAMNAAFEVETPIPIPRTHPNASVESALEREIASETREEKEEPTKAGTDNMPTDDYRDLLVFAQDAINRTMDLSRQLLATKDELLRMKEERLQELQATLQKNELEMRRLRKKVEDLETLCRLTPNI
jgi:hypothetical protein